MRIKLSITLIIFLKLSCLKAFSYDIAIQNNDGVTIYYNFTNNQSELEVTYGPSKYAGDIVIPEKVSYTSKQFNVTSIGQWAFSGCSFLKTVSIPDGVTSRGYL